MFAKLRLPFLSYVCLVAGSLYAGALEDCIARLDELSADAGMRTPYVTAVSQSKVLDPSERTFVELPTEKILNKKITKPLKRVIRSSINHIENTAFPGVELDYHKADPEFTSSKNKLIEFLYSLDSFVTAVLKDAGAQETFSRNRREFTVRTERTSLWGERKQRQQNLSVFHRHSFPPRDFEYTLSTNWSGTLFKREGQKPFVAAPGRLTLFRPNTSHARPWSPFFFPRVFLYGRIKE